MIQKKICMLGAFAVGKTSLVKRYIHSMFSDKYLSTVGVKIDKKVLHSGDSEVMLMLWDLYGEDSFQKVQMSYLKGTAGFLLIVDGTRIATLQTALGLRNTVLASVGKIPYIIVINKMDLRADWEIKQSHIDELVANGEVVLLASAKTGDAVEEAFSSLTARMLRS